MAAPTHPRNGSYDCRLFPFVAVVDAIGQRVPQSGSLYAVLSAHRARHCLPVVHRLAFLADHPVQCDGPWGVFDAHAGDLALAGAHRADRGSARIRRRRSICNTKFYASLFRRDLARSRLVLRHFRNRSSRNHRRNCFVAAYCRRISFRRGFAAPTLAVCVE